MQCKNCGAEVGIEYRLCPYCHSEIEYPNSNSQQPQTIIIQNVMPNANNDKIPQQGTIKKEKKQIKNKTLSAVIISSFVILIALLLFVIMFIAFS